MFEAGEVIDDRYTVLGTCSEAGGMGSLLFVQRLDSNRKIKRVLKFCKQTSDESLRRFRREVRLMKDFKGNSRVMQVIYSNLEHEPPYFVMKHYEEGDLTGIVPKLRDDYEEQERVFDAMIDCIAELHAEEVFHRDIKPQNFLVDGDEIVVSDFGLSTEIDSSTLFTRSTMGWGTPGYLPPEFCLPGGFKNADASSDVFMLGKTFYFLLTGRDPTYLLPDDVPKPLMVVIERCCVAHKPGRYQSLSSLRQSLTSAYDVLLNRVVGSALAVRTLRSIVDRLKTSGRYRATEVSTFINELAMLEGAERDQLCKEIAPEVFTVLAQTSLKSDHSRFLAAYREMAKGGSYGWSFAETIASNMQTFFDSEEVSAADRAEALRIAILAAESQNRFAAMDTCREMIRGVVDEELAQHVHDVIIEFQDTFIAGLEESSVRAAAIRSALASLKKQSSDEGDDDL
ncbi:protein kinase [Ideonella sp. 4Y16]|uniref:protein kinase domain-containing protein n=1 Tax=Ideonella alba TaxID=2824118 RepID=UPI001B3947CD|nr:protein kinase [Ideonella alba]MBQ0943431.1 protein kinase [Ideonella alba]